MRALRNGDGHRIPKAVTDVFDFAIEATLSVERLVHAHDEKVEALLGLILYRFRRSFFGHACRDLDIARAVLIGLGDRFRRVFDNRLEAPFVALLVPALRLGIDVKHGDRQPAPASK